MVESEFSVAGVPNAAVLPRDVVRSKYDSRAGFPRQVPLTGGGEKRSRDSRAQLPGEHGGELDQLLIVDDDSPQGTRAAQSLDLQGSQIQVAG